MAEAQDSPARAVAPVRCECKLGLLQSQRFQPNNGGRELLAIRCVRCDRTFGVVEVADPTELILQQNRVLNALAERAGLPGVLPVDRAELG